MIPLWLKELKPSVLPWNKLKGEGCVSEFVGSDLLQNVFLTLLECQKRNTEVILINSDKTMVEKISFCFRRNEVEVDIK